MPPNDPNNTTRRVIDVQMAAPPEFMAVMDQMVNQMAAVSAQLAAVSDTTPEGRAQAARTMGSATRRGAVPAGSRGFASVGDQSKQAERTDGLSEGASVAPNAEPKPKVSLSEAQAAGAESRESRRLDPLAQRARMAQGEPLEKPRATLADARETAQRQLAEGQIETEYRRKTPEEIASLQAPSDAARLSLREKMHVAASHLHNLSARVEAKTGIQLPVLSKIGGVLPSVAGPGVGAEEAEEPQEGEAQRRHPVAREITGLANSNIFQTWMLNRMMTAGRNEVRQAEYGNLGGVQAGFDRPGVINIPGTEIGMINPLDALQRGSAFREALNQRINVQRLRLRGGINQEQAQSIIGNVAGLGWTGEFGQNMAFDNVAPLVQQGQNPALVARMMDQAARNGQTPLAELRQTLDQLGPSARAAHQSLDEYQQGLDEFANNLTKQGATYGQGVQTARQLTTALGMPGGQVQELQNMPLTQAMGATRFGALPWEMGALGTAGNFSAMGGAVDMAMQAGSGFLNTPIKGPDGRTLVSGERRQELFAAQALGINQTTLHRFLEGREQAPHILGANATLDRLRTKQRLLDAGDDSKHGTGAQFHEGTSKPGDWVPVSPSAPGAVKKGGFWVKKATVGGEGGRVTFGGPEGRDAAAVDVTKDWRSVTDEMVRTARTVDDRGERGQMFKEINKIKDIEDPHKRGKEARDFLSRAAARVTEREAEQKVAVEFTGPAARYFQRVASKLPKEFRDADAGGRSKSEAVIADNQVDSLAELRNTFASPSGSNYGAAGP